jgi:hypothetical protein
MQTQTATKPAEQGESREQQEPFGGLEESVQSSVFSVQEEKNGPRSFGRLPRNEKHPGEEEKPDTPQGIFAGMA